MPLNRLNEMVSHHTMETKDNTQADLLMEQWKVLMIGIGFRANRLAKIDELGDVGEVLLKEIKDGKLWEETYDMVKLNQTLVLESKIYSVSRFMNLVG